MHEWALAESIITTVLEAAEKEKLKTISEIIIRIGELQQIEQDIFEFALKEIMQTEKKPFACTKITIETEKSMLHCKNCEHIWSFNELKKKLNEDESEAIHFIPEVAFVHARCPKCGSPDFDIQSGRGVTISSIKGQRD
jgi:hydrogenase nickel incorporation protein HypA/HybF